MGDTQNFTKDKMNRRVDIRIFEKRAKVKKEVTGTEKNSVGIQELPKIVLFGSCSINFNFLCVFLSLSTFPANVFDVVIFWSSTF